MNTIPAAAASQSIPNCDRFPRLSTLDPRPKKSRRTFQMALLSVRGLVKSYGRRRVVDGVDFDVDPGEIVGLLGPNGAGKTTSFRMACGMIDPDAGKVTLAGKDVTKWPMYRRAKEGGMGYLVQESSVFRKLSVQKNLLGVMEMLGMKRKVRNRRADQLMEQFGIEKLRRSKAMSLSGGERRRLEIADRLFPTRRLSCSMSRSPASIP